MMVVVMMMSLKMMIKMVMTVIMMKDVEQYHEHDDTDEKQL